jgi:hypothetical protein
LDPGWAHCEACCAENQEWDAEELQEVEMWKRERCVAGGAEKESNGVGYRSHAVLPALAHGVQGCIEAVLLGRRPLDVL